MRPPEHLAYTPDQRALRAEVRAYFAALVTEGRTNREVAAALFLGERTVESHLTRVYEKLGVHRRTEAVERARDLGLLAAATRRRG